MRTRSLIPRLAVSPTITAGAIFIFVEPHAERVRDPSIAAVCRCHRRAGITDGPLEMLMSKKKRKQKPAHGVAEIGVRNTTLPGGDPRNVAAVSETLSDRNRLREASGDSPPKSAGVDQE